jgi:hypothetical protein
MRTTLAVLFLLATIAAAPAQQQSACSAFGPACDDLNCRQGGPTGSEKYLACRKLREQFNQVAQQINASIIKGMQVASTKEVYAPVYDLQLKAWMNPNDSKECLNTKLDIMTATGNIFMRVGARAKEFVDKFGINAWPTFEAQARKEVAEITQSLEKRFEVLLVTSCSTNGVTQ